MEVFLAYQSSTFPSTTPIRFYVRISEFSSHELQNWGEGFTPGLDERILMFCFCQIAVSKQNSGCDVTQWWFCCALLKMFCALSFTFKPRLEQTSLRAIFWSTLWPKSYSISCVQSVANALGSHLASAHRRIIMNRCLVTAVAVPLFRKKCRCAVVL